MKIILLDVFALLHRSYHALPRLTTAEGKPIGATYGFASVLLKVLRELKPDYVFAAIDLPEPTFRHREFTGYQAARPPTPGDLASQIENIKTLLEAFGIPVYAAPGFEADDVIGSLAEKLKEKNHAEIWVLTGDRDALQLIDSNVKIYAFKKGVSEMAIYDRDAFRNQFGFDAELLPDYKGLAGDASDNIPGVPGIGPKTAHDLISRFGMLEELYRSVEGKNFQKLPPKVVEKLITFKEQAFLSKKLGTIRRDAPIPDPDFSNKSPTGDLPPKARDLFSAWGFRALLARTGGQRTLGL